MLPKVIYTPQFTVRFCLLLVLAFITSNAMRADAAPLGPPALPEIVGNIEKFSGTVYIKPAGATKQIKLRQGADVGSPLRRGTALWIAPQSRILFYVGKREHDLRGPLSFSIPNPTKLDPRVVDALQAGYATGGGERPGFSLLLIPIDGSTMRADAFEIRWKALPPDWQLQFQLTKGKEETPFWQSPPVVATTRTYKDEALTKALAERQHPTDLEKITLTAIGLPPNNPDGSVAAERRTEMRFYLMSAEAANKIETELQQTTSDTTGILKAMLRAGILRDAKLYDEWTRELEAIYQLNPQSEEIKAQLEAAELTIGNVDKAGKPRLTP